MSAQPVDPTTPFGTEPLNLSDPELHTDDPWPLYNWMREEHPVYLDANGVWYASRYDDVTRIAMDPETFTSVHGNRPRMPNDDSFIHLEGKAHHQRRGLIQHLFTPAAMKRLEGHVRDVVDILIDNVIEQGECDFVGDLAAPLPMQLIGEMLGTPPETWDDIREWLDVFVPGGQGPEFVNEEVNEMFIRFGALHMQLVEERTAEPKDDLLSLWIKAQIDGQGMTDDQILWEHTMLTVGGSETTRNAISGGLVELLANPDQFEYLRHNPQGVNNAVSEILRWTTPFIGMSRTMTRDVVMHEQTLKEGEQVLLLWPAANRDPRKFDDPMRFDVRRDFKSRQIAFGIGQHVCLGEHLARLEAKIVVEQVLKRMPDVRIAGEPEKSRSSFIRGYRTLPLAFTPGARVRP